MQASRQGEQPLCCLSAAPMDASLLRATSYSMCTTCNSSGGSSNRRQLQAQRQLPSSCRRLNAHKRCVWFFFSGNSTQSYVLSFSILPFCPRLYTLFSTLQLATGFDAATTDVYFFFVFLCLLRFTYFGFFVFLNFLTGLRRRLPSATALLLLLSPAPSFSLQLLFYYAA